ncbi:MAG TPA: LLM class flavin-dependent oxidoreductase, partial [Chloroflexota bacterium]
RIFAARQDAHLDFARARPSIPVYVGAVNGRMLRAAGALADGVQLGAIVSPGYAAWAWQQVQHGARDAVRTVLAYYIHRVESVVLSTSGADPEELRRVRETVLEQGLPAGARLVTDGLIDTFAAAGDPEAVCERLRAYLAAGLRGVLAWHVIGPDPARSLQLLAEVVRPRVFD